MQKNPKHSPLFLMIVRDFKNKIDGLNFEKTLKRIFELRLRKFLYVFSSRIL